MIEWVDVPEEERMVDPRISKKIRSEAYQAAYKACREGQRASRSKRK